MDKKPGSRRSRGYVRAPGRSEAEWTGITVTCSRGGHAPQRWKLRRDKAGSQAGQIWFTARPDGTLPEQSDQPEGRDRLRFGCPVCGHDVIWTLDAANLRFDTLDQAGRRTAEYPL